MKVVICTAGTSIAKDADSSTDRESYKRQIRERVKQYEDADLSQDEFSKLSAELQSLQALGINPDDEIYLLHTDTTDGAVCAECVAEVLEKHWDVCPDCKSIGGLQVEDGSRFRREGVDNLFSELSDLTSPYEYRDDVSVQMNVTGGFKSVVPFVTVFGLMHRLDVVYIHETSRSLITLPPLPVQFDFERLEQAADAMRRVREEGVTSKEEFFNHMPNVPFQDRRYYECLLEEDEEGMVTLSAIARQLDTARQQEGVTVYLSSNAKETLNKARGDGLQQLEFMLKRVGDPMWRRQHRHSFTGTDLEVYKPGNTAQRMAGYLSGREFYVCELYLGHDDYTRDLKGRKKEDYSPKYFEVWSGPSDQTVAESETENELASTQIEEVRLEKDSVAEQLENKKQELADAQKKRKQCEQTYAELEEQLASQKQEVSRLQNEIEALNSRSWWKRLLNRR